MAAVTVPFEPVLLTLLAGLAGGLTMLMRGLGGYRLSERISDTAGSRIASLAVGEVRLTGIVEPAELLLTSPLQSATCVYYRSLVEVDEGRSSRTEFREERAVGFRLRDETGSIRVFPRGARWAIADTFHGSTSLLGDQPSGLDVRVGPAVTAGSVDHDVAVATLLSVRDARVSEPDLAGLHGTGHRRYREARIEPGEIITIVGFVEPFDQLPDPTGADDANFFGNSDDPLADPAIAADLHAARAAGELVETPEEAWGNAAIPGFGIGQPVREPELDDGATHLPLANAAAAARAERTFTIDPEELVLAAVREVPLLITLGAPVAAAAREQRRFAVGLLGAILAIASAMALAVLVSGAIVL